MINDALCLSISFEEVFVSHNFREGNSLVGAFANNRIARGHIFCWKKYDPLPLNIQDNIRIEMISRKHRNISQYFDYFQYHYWTS